MMTRVLYTSGEGSFFETSWDNPEPTDNEIEVRAVMTDICRSDIDMMQGKFKVLPLYMSGHEGIGQITKAGANIQDVKVGDFVATRGEPAYADYYNVRQTEYVQIPEPLPKYILEPVACGINVVEQALDEIKKRCITNSKLVILGSGFLAWVAYHKIQSLKLNILVDVLGASNQALWDDKLLLGTSESYDVVIDLSGKYELGTEINLNNNALIIDGVGKAVSKQEAQSQLWKAVTTIKPSPRNPEFIDCMHFAKHWIENGYLEVDSFWSRSYNRNTDWQRAFEEGVNRPVNYSRGYIIWE